MATLITPDEGMRQDFQTGMGLAQGFMQNYWRGRETALEQERYRAGQALRDVQLSLAQSNLETVRNAATLQAQTRAAIPGLYGLASKAQVNDWNPDTKLEVLEYLSKNPALAGTPEAKNILGMFDESEKISREREALQMRLENEREVARIRTEREARDMAPKYIVNTAGEPVEVTAGGAVRPIRVFSDVEQADIESTVRMLTKAVEDAAGLTQKQAATKARDEYVAKMKSEESARKADLVRKIRGPEQAASPTENTEARTWQQMVTGQTEPAVVESEFKPAMGDMKKQTESPFIIRLKR